METEVFGEPCTKGHGGPGNPADIYGHTVGMTCVRVGKDLWLQVSTLHLKDEEPFDPWEEDDE